MKNSQLIIGIILMVLAAAIFVFNITDYYTPIAITILILGMGLTANARRG
jgi:predicted Na+-dependent transporter